MSKVTKQITKEDIYQAFMDIEWLSNLFESQNSIRHQTLGLVSVVQKGQTEFDYDSDSGKTTKCVFKIGDFHIQLTGVYYSYSGLRLASWDFVQPKEVTKVEFVKA